MNKNLAKVVGDDQEKRAKPRYTRLLVDDDRQVMERTDAPSTLIADLVHKGLAYEALARGADDPVIRNLLRTFDQIIQHRLTPVMAALDESRRAHLQTQTFIACLFLTMTARFEFPLENCSDDDRDEIHELLTVPANDMLTLATTPTTGADVPDTHQHETASPAAASTVTQRVSG
jgi:hypothetical protein